MNPATLFQQPHFTNCPDCHIPKTPLISPGGLDFGMHFDCDCAYNREMAIRKNRDSYHEKELITNRLKISGLSADHLVTIKNIHFIESAYLVNESRRYLSEFNLSWMFMMADSGTGKTTALTWLGYSLITEKQKRAGYFVMGDLIEALRLRGYTSKATIEDLLSYDVIIIDDFFKGDECSTKKVQDQFKRLIDLFIRHQKIMLIGADISLPTIYNKLDDEYKKQITERIGQKCGKWLVGKNNLPNLRNSTQLSFQDKLNEIPEGE